MLLAVSKVVYTISPYRKEFDARTTTLRAAAYDVSSTLGVRQNIRDLVFQAAILQSSAAIEDYLKAMFDAWMFKVKSMSVASNRIPMRIRASVAADKIARPIYSYAASQDETELLKRLAQETATWQWLEGSVQVPKYIDGSCIYKDRKYPSPKNVKVLFYRIGVDNVFDRAAEIIKADAEMKLIAFNDIRTALAHAQPPQITYLDVRRNIENVQSIVRALDRIAHKALSGHIGQPAW